MNLICAFQSRLDLLSVSNVVERSGELPSLQHYSVACQVLQSTNHCNAEVLRSGIYERAVTTRLISWLQVKELADAVES